MKYQIVITGAIETDVVSKSFLKTWLMLGGT